MRPGAPAPNTLTTLRLLFFSLAMSPLLAGLVVIVSTPGRPPGDEDPRFYSISVGALGVLSLILVQWLRRRPLDVTSKEQLVASFRTNFFLGFAFTDVPIILGLIGALRTHELLIYGEALVFFVIAMLLIAPTRANLDRRQQQITAQGSPLFLVEALREPASGP
jgi:hypothetical protein